MGRRNYYIGIWAEIVGEIAILISAVVVAGCLFMEKGCGWNKLISVFVWVFAGVTFRDIGKRFLRGDFG